MTILRRYAVVGILGYILGCTFAAYLQYPDKSYQYDVLLLSGLIVSIILVLAFSIMLAFARASAYLFRRARLSPTARQRQSHSDYLYMYWPVWAEDEHRDTGNPFGKPDLMVTSHGIDPAAYDADTTDTGG